MVPLRIIYESLLREVREDEEIAKSEESSYTRALFHLHESSFDSSGISSEIFSFQFRFVLLLLLLFDYDDYDRRRTLFIPIKNHSLVDSLMSH
jgi:hypothetical protein